MTIVTEAGRPAPSTDGRRARGDSTRRAILGRSMRLASAGGLEGLSIARLASDLGMSKSGLFAHFGSKEELQLSTVRAARRVFSDEAVTPGAGRAARASSASTRCSPPGTTTSPATRSRAAAS